MQKKKKITVALTVIQNLSNKKGLIKQILVIPNYELLNHFRILYNPRFLK